MAIQTRRGPEKDFDANKLLPGEFAGTTDTKRIFYAFAAGDTKEIATYEDMKKEINNVTGDIVAELTDGVDTAIENTNKATESANKAASDANTAKESAETAIQEANKAISDADAAAKAALEAADKADKAVIDDSVSSTSKTYSSSKINDLISGVTGFSVKVVDILPTSDIDTHTIYFVQKETSSEGDIYDEYLYIQNAWEHIGSTNVDLSQYYTKTEANSRDLADNTVEFTSNDVGPDGEYAIVSVEKLTTGEKMSSVMKKVSRIFTNVRYILNRLGTNDISSESSKIGDGTVTGAIRYLNDNFLDKAYPVGSIYMSVANKNPSSLFGGTWVSWGSGRVPVGVNTSNSNFNTVEKTGGSSSVTLTEENIPAHTHNQYSINTDDNPKGGTAMYSFTSEAGTAVGFTNKKTHSNNIITGSAGSGKAHTNLQPYITCYMWKRTA